MSLLATGRPAVAVTGEAVEETTSSAARDPAQPQAIGRVFVAGPGEPAFVVLSSVGYAYTEAVLGRGDAHHRGMGALTLDGRPLSWLAIALKLDGRYDLHLVPGQPRDVGLVGDPRFYLRVDHRLAPSVRIAARLGLWLPGRDAPSMDFTAITPELSAALTYAVPGVPVWFTTNLGYRIDRSARTAKDAPLLSAADRSALEVNAFDQLLLGVGSAFGGGPVQGFVEASGEILVGSGHPSLSRSPLWIGGGARVAVSRNLRVEAGIEVAASTRPALGPTDPLVPVPPRVAGWLGLSYRFSAAPVHAPEERLPPPPASPRPPPAIEPPAPTVPSPAPAATTSVDGRIETESGAVPLEAAILAENDQQTSPVPVDAEGRFTLKGAVGRAIIVRAQAPGYQPSTRTVTLAEGEMPPLVFKLHSLLPSGQIRGLVRSLTSHNVEAQVRVQPLGLVLNAAEGRFEADVAPGNYEVIITAPGFETQRRRVVVEQNGVTVLNIDLRKKR
jgi:hypothetical protein